MRNSDKIIGALLDSYREDGMVNPAGESNLPAKCSIETLLQELTELLLPGFGETEAPDSDNLSRVTGEQLIRTAEHLETEVEKTVAFAFREQLVPQADHNVPVRGCRAAAELITTEFFEELPLIRKMLDLDIQAAFRGDPAARSMEEVILSYPGLEAIVVHRLAYFLWKREVPLIPRMMSEIIHHRTGIDIHPGAVIGESFFIDHGTGVVIGETTVIGKNVKLYQGVTLGALSVKKELANKKRHPTIEDDVTIYSGATILGGETIIGKGSVIGGNVWITQSVPPFSTVYVAGAGQVTEKR